MTRPFLTARWRSLVILNFEVDASTVRPLVPAGTELDLWNGRALASVVGFRFLDTRLLGVPVPLHRSFEEVNLRFYVRRRTSDGWRRGVVFVKEVVPKRAVSFVARRVYGENYVTRPTDSRVRLPSGPEDDGELRYTWKSEAGRLTATARVRGLPSLPPVDSLEAFITDHYWGYTRRRDGATVEYRVEHPRWRVWPDAEGALDGDVVAFYGPPLGEALEAGPASALVAEGSEVAVFRGDRLETTSTR